MKEILSKPKLEEGDASIVAACVAFIGTSKKMADKFAQALLDTAESFIQGMCVRCGAVPPGTGDPVEPDGEDCLICQGIRNVQTLKKVQENSHEETLEAKLEREADEKYIDEHGLEPIVDIEQEQHEGVDIPEEVLEGIDNIEEGARKPWTEEELNFLELNKSLGPNALAKFGKLSGRTPEEIQEKLEELYGP